MVERWEQIKQLLDRVVRLEASERESYVEQHCAGDSQLRDEVLSLLRAGEVADEFPPPDSETVELSRAPATLAGRTLGHFRIVDELGRGGMGVVYRAQDERLRREVALKVLGADVAWSEGRRKRLVHEARMVARIEHANVARIYELNESDGHPFVVMELVKGQSLRAKLGGGPLARNEAVRVALDICHGLGAAHALGIVHRDLKPENVVIANDGSVKILDFGIAKLLAGDEPAQSDTEDTRSLLFTRPGHRAGTVPYMSPEQITGGAVDSRSDIFSFGVMLYELLTGTRPFRAQTTPELISAIVSQPAPLLSDARPELGTRFDPLIRKCLAKSPGDRFQTIEEVARAFAGLTAGRRLLPAVVATIVLLAGAAGLAWWRWDRAPAPVDTEQQSRLRVAVAPFVLAGSAGDDGSGAVVQSLIERGIREISADTPLQLLEGSLSQPIASEQAARAAGEELGADVLCWGKVLRAGGETEIEARITLVNGLERFEAYESEVSYVPEMTDFLQAVRRVPLDSSGDFDAWRSSADDMTAMIATLSALSLFKQGEYARAASILATLPEPTRDQRFYHGLALLRDGEPFEAAAKFEEILAEDSQHAGARIALLAARPLDLGSTQDRNVLLEAALSNPTDERTNAALALAVMFDLLQPGNPLWPEEEIAQHLGLLCREAGEGRLSESVQETALLVTFMLRAAYVMRDRPAPPFVEASATCPAYAAVLEARPLLMATLCLPSLESRSISEQCVNWKPEPYQVGPVIYAAFTHGSPDEIPPGDALELARNDTRPLAERLPWAQVLDAQPALDWLDREFEESERQDWRYLTARGRVLLRMGRSAEARDHYEQALKRIGQSDEIAAEIAISLLAEERFAEAVETLADTDTEGRALALAADGRLCDAYSGGDPKRPGYSELLALCRVVEKSKSVHAAFVERIRAAVVESARDPQREYRQVFRLTPHDPRPRWHETLRLTLDVSLPRSQLGLIDAVRELSADVDRDELAAVVGELSELVHAYAKANRTDPYELSDRQREIATRIRVGEFERAEADLREALEEDPDNLWALGMLGDLLERAGRFDEALPIRQRHRELEPKNVWLHTWIGRDFLKLGKHDEAEKAQRQALSLDPDFARAHYELGWIRRDQGKMAEAIPYLERATELNPREPWFWEDLAGALHDQKRYAEAEPAFKRAIALRPEKAWTHYLLGWNYRRQSRIADSIEPLRQATKLDDKEPLYWQNLAMALHDEGRHDEAEPCFLRALELNPDNAWTHHLMGKGYRLQKRLDEAEAAQKRALELSPDYAWARHEMGRTLVEQGRTDEAVVHLRRAAELDRNVVDFWEQLAVLPDIAHRHDALRNLGRTQRDAGRLDDAIASLELAVAEAEREHGGEHASVAAGLDALVPARIAAAQDALARRDAGRLIDLRRKAADREGAEAREYNAIAWLLLTCDVVDLRDTQTALRYAIAANPPGAERNPSHLDTLALAYHRTGKSADAARVQREALELLAADSPDREEFRVRLEEYLTAAGE